MIEWVGFAWKQFGYIPVYEMNESVSLKCLYMWMQIMSTIVPAVSVMTAWFLQDNTSYISSSVMDLRVNDKESVSRCSVTCENLNILNEKLDNVNMFQCGGWISVHLV